jgi:SAM-dependent methyltransferase
MPDARVLESMYGGEYSEGSDPDGDHVRDPKEPEWVLDWLGRLEPGTFVDYGCGRGELLVEASRRGWDVVGVELVEEVARAAASRTGLAVVTVEEVSKKTAAADVLHVGDVLEHLTDLESEMPRILSLVKPGGLLLAQGPLEANGNLYTWMVRLGRFTRRRKPVEMAPYHVILATAAGQRALFHRFGLTTLEESVTEVSWPAPERLSSKELRAPRLVALFLLRRTSRVLSRARPRHWGNRYRYAGRTKTSSSDVRHW